MNMSNDLNNLTGMKRYLKRAFSGISTPLLQAINTAGSADRPYGAYVANLTQLDDGEPTVSVLENTLNLGAVTVKRVSPGTFTIKTTDAMYPPKTCAVIHNTFNGISFIEQIDDNTISLFTYDVLGVSADRFLFRSMLEIRVYK
jgi:hypothetical protein